MSFVLHLFQSGQTPPRVASPPCTLALLKSSPPPPPPPFSASHLKQTRWTACMTFQLCGWHNLFFIFFLQRLQQHTGLLKPSSPGEPPPSRLHHPQAGAQLSSGGGLEGWRGGGEDEPIKMTLKTSQKYTLKGEFRVPHVRRQTCISMKSNRNVSISHRHHLLGLKSIICFWKVQISKSVT